MNKYQKLFEPIKIGKMEVKNKISMAPLGMVAMSEPTGAFTQRAQEYYIERARGGTGLIITGVTNVNYYELPDGSLPCATANPLFFMTGCKHMNDRIHSYDAKIFLQLTGGFGRVFPPNHLKVKYGPSETTNRWDPSVEHREMTIDEIHQLIQSFITAAVVAKESNFDGVEIHAVHEGYLLDQFAISLYNKRTDEYGGDLRGRLKLATDIVTGIKAACGKDFPVSLRYSVKSFVKELRQGALPGETFVEKGKDIEEGLEAAKILVAAGYDALNVDAGTYDSWYWNHPPMYFEKGMYREFGKMIKEVVDVPVILAGRMDDPDMACESIGRDCDMISYGRPLLADPELPNKIKAGDLEDIRPCLSCHQACLGRIAEGMELSCAVNPACGREKDYALIRTLEPKHVLVIGGGPAGMEAARVCALKGHFVELWEKNDELGGNLIPGSAPPFKKDDAALIRWYKLQLEKLQVQVITNYTATIDKINRTCCDVVIMAAGSYPINIDLGQNSHIYCASEILNHKEKAGDKIIVVGGGLVGCETALWLRMLGKEVTIVEMQPEILAGGPPAIGGKLNMCFSNYDMLKDLLNYHQVTIYTDARVTTVTKDQVYVSTEDGEVTIPADTVIEAVGYKSNNDLLEPLINSRKIFYNIGDSRKVDNIMNAIWDAYQVAREI